MGMWAPSVNIGGSEDLQQGKGECRRACIGSRAGAAPRAAGKPVATIGKGVNAPDSVQNGREGPTAGSEYMDLKLSLSPAQICSDQGWEYNLCIQNASLRLVSYTNPFVSKASGSTGVFGKLNYTPLFSGVRPYRFLS